MSNAKPAPRRVAKKRPPSRKTQAKAPAQPISVKHDVHLALTPRAGTLVLAAVLEYKRRLTAPDPADAAIIDAVLTELTS